MKTCKGCEEGMDLLMLDEDGVRCTESGKSGLPCHANDDTWWPCGYHKGRVNEAKKEFIRIINAWLK